MDVLGDLGNINAPVGDVLGLGHAGFSLAASRRALLTCLRSKMRTCASSEHAANMVGAVGSNATSDVGP